MIPIFIFISTCGRFTYHCKIYISLKGFLSSLLKYLTQNWRVYDKVKICGLTSIEDAQLINTYKADFAGLVMFFPKSKRNMTSDRVSIVLSALDAKIKKVAIVVSPTEAEIEVVENLSFDYIQIHGELSEELINKIHLPILKAFNVNDMDKFDFYHNYPQIVGYVFDATEPGSGKTFDWNLVNAIPRDEKMLILAGGLNAENVKKAMAAVNPDAVDVSSAVEYADKPGKDEKKVKEFI